MTDTSPGWIPFANIALWAGVAWLVRYLGRNPRSQLNQVLLISWGARPSRRFDPLTRRDRLRSAGWATAAAVGLIAVSYASMWGGEQYPGLSKVGMVLMGAGFIIFILAAIAAVGALGQLLGAMFMRQPRPRTFTITSHGMRIGSSDFERADAEHQLLYGIFLPDREFRAVYHVFEEWVRACTQKVGEVTDQALAARYAADLRNLDLRVTGPGGVIDFPALIHIEDITVTKGSDRLVVQIHSPEFEAWRIALRAHRKERS